MPAQAGAFRVVATLPYLGKGVPGRAEESIDLAKTPENQRLYYPAEANGLRSALRFAASPRPHPLPPRAGCPQNHHLPGRLRSGNRGGLKEQEL